MTDAGEAWSAFLNPDVIRTKLVSAGLFLVAHEMLRDGIIRHPRYFFSNGFSAENGWEVSPKYRTNVLALDPKGKNDELRGSIAWFKSSGAIDEGDELILKQVTDVRNQIAHELVSFVGGIQPIDIADKFAPMVSLINKIEKWWIINFEIATDPAFDNHDLTDNDFVPGPAWMMDILVRVALGDHDEARALHREFESQWQTRSDHHKSNPKD